MIHTRTKLLSYVRRHAASLWLSIGVAGMVGLFEAASAFLISGVFDSFAGSTGLTRIPGLDVDLPRFGRNVLLSILVAVTIAKALAEFAGVSATAWLGHAVVRDVRNDVFRRILHQPLRFFHDNPTAELISRVSTDIEKVQGAVSETLAEFFKQSGILLCLTATIFLIDWQLSLASLLLVPPVFAMTLFFGKKLRSLGKSNQQELAEMANVLHEAFAGNRIVKAFRMEEPENTRFRTATQRLFRTNLRQRMTHALSSPLMEIVGVFAIAGFVLYADARIAAGAMSGGLFVAFIYALVKLYDAVRRISGINNSFQQALGASSRIAEILDLEPEQDSGTVRLSRFGDVLELQSVDFAYTPGVPVLRGVSCSVRRGEVVAVVGASGAGKSTLVNLLPRFYDVTGGAILIDGVDIREYTLASLRGQMSIVTQDVILFDDTIWANIAYGGPASSKDQVLEAARAALVDQFVPALPNGYQTRVGERGLRLSGGERQRISIARALLKNAPILILDEATSALDAESEVYVQRALQNLMEGRTTVVIAHRLSTVRRADRIIVLHGGRIQESGRHEDLLERRGTYWKLYNLQFSDQSAIAG